MKPLSETIFFPLYSLKTKDSEILDSKLTNIFNGYFKYNENNKIYDLKYLNINYDTFSDNNKLISIKINLPLIYFLNNDIDINNINFTANFDIFNFILDSNNRLINSNGLLSKKKNKIIAEIKCSNYESSGIKSIKNKLNEIVKL